MSVTAWIIAGLSAALFAAVAIGGLALKIEKARHEREVNRIKKEGAENAQKTADIITEAEKIKSDANTGNHAGDMLTMAERLRDYADGGK
ncbi:MAG: hypothetical protein II814_01025 [Treponema sp.]|nr:hypothetical protein [Treponema sp.]